MYTKTFTYEAPAVYNATQCISAFEADAAAYISELTAHDIGGIVVYKDASGNDKATFDYELLLGHIY